MNILKQVTFDRASRKKDRSISMTFITSLEQSPAEFMAIDELLNESGVLFFKNNGELTSDELKELGNVEIENEGKTKSQRLRNVLFVHWKQQQFEGDFNAFYANEMEKIIEHYKSKLSPDK